MSMRSRSACASWREDLILFRDKQGRLRPAQPRCAHRGTSLFYGKVDENGIRCCYHGWQFDVEGRCIDQPCEPDNGRRIAIASGSPGIRAKSATVSSSPIWARQRRRPVLPQLGRA